MAAPDTISPLPETIGRLVLLGAGGFLAGRLAAALSRMGHPFEALGRNRIDLTAPGAAAALRGIIRPGDTVVFLAAITPDRDRTRAGLAANLAMGEAVVDALRDRPPAHLVYVGTDAVYPFDGRLVREDTPPSPYDYYGHAHLLRETMLETELDLPLSRLRLTAIYGPGDTHDAYGPNRFLRQALTEGRIELFGQGEEYRDHLFVDDTVALILAAIAARHSGILNLATGRSLSFREVAERVAAAAHRPVEIVTSPRAKPIVHRHFDVVGLLKAFPTLGRLTLEDRLALTRSN